MIVALRDREIERVFNALGRPGQSLTQSLQRAHVDRTRIGQDHLAPEPRGRANGDFLPARPVDTSKRWRGVQKIIDSAGEGIGVGVIAGQNPSPREIEGPPKACWIPHVLDVSRSGVEVRDVIPGRIRRVGKTRVRVPRPFRGIAGALRPGPSIGIVLTSQDPLRAPQGHVAIGRGADPRRIRFEWRTLQRCCQANRIGNGCRMSLQTMQPLAQLKTPAMHQATRTERARDGGRCLHPVAGPHVRCAATVSNSVRSSSAATTGRSRCSTTHSRARAPINARVSGAMSASLRTAAASAAGDPSVA